MRKYRKGERLTVAQAFEEIAAGRPIFAHDKVLTAGWTRSWQINYAISAARQGYLFAAERTVPELPACPHCGYRHPPDGICV